MHPDSEEAIFQKIQEIIVNVTGNSPRDIFPGARLVDDLGFESMEDVEVLQALEEEYHITITQDDVGDLLTFHHLHQMIVKKVEEKTSR